MITVECKHCGKITAKTTQRYRESIKMGWNFFCSRECRYGYQVSAINVPCAQCGKIVRKTPTQIRRTKMNVFCSKSCGAIYNNSHKVHGVRRSRLESYIEKRLLQEFPNIQVQFNTTEPIGIELDFYFPTIELAVELNGIIHYKPIYGRDKFERIQWKDHLKADQCLKNGITLSVVDVSSMRNFTESDGETYWSIIRTVICSAIERGLTLKRTESLRNVESVELADKP